MFFPSIIKSKCILSYTINSNILGEKAEGAEDATSQPAAAETEEPAATEAPPTEEGQTEAKEEPAAQAEGRLIFSWINQQEATPQEAMLPRVFFIK